MAALAASLAALAASLAALAALAAPAETSLIHSMILGAFISPAVKQHEEGRQTEEANQARPQGAGRSKSQ